MNINVCYNVFDNEELLEDSILNIRNYVEEITILFQNVSNVGIKAEPHLQDFLLELKNKKIVDNLVLYNPNLSNGAQWNEIRKNQISYEMAKQKKLDYHMVMACDEFYFEDDFLKLKSYLKENSVDIVTSYMFTYYKSTNYRFKEIENYVVPIMHKIYNDDRNFSLNSPMPLLIDPTRKMRYDSCFCFPKETPLMHHLSHVRKNYRKKLENSTAKINWLNEIDRMVKEYENWKPIQDAYLFGKYVPLEYTDKFSKEIIF